MPNKLLQNTYGFSTKTCRLILVFYSSGDYNMTPSCFWHSNCIIYLFTWLALCWRTVHNHSNISLIICTAPFKICQKRVTLYKLNIILLCHCDQWWDHETSDRERTVGEVAYTSVLEETVRRFQFNQSTLVFLASLLLEKKTRSK